MEKVIQFLVSDQVNAYKVVEKLKDLDTKSDISTDKIFVLVKDENGKVSLKDSNGDIADNTLFGLFAGGLIGFFGGPVGFLLGSSFGALFGSLADLGMAERQNEYLDKVAEKIPAGKSLVVAHVFEDWTTPIDSSLTEIAEITRIDVSEEVNKAIETEIDSFKADIDKIESDIKNTIKEQRETLQAKLTELKTKRQSKEAELKARVELQKNAYKNWLAKAKDKIKSLSKKED
ncbi:DUF1269 domain-containing protein [Pedobacter nanyangensis]|uniref:DUF1269 domain-containing protein n=1 Tax=Pedobacter nanyangensis TaxID=1562389 RepID=UPI000DE1B776|nr:DUF1269 domain-containing protein [Pedobacter nanyangensis]